MKPALLALAILCTLRAWGADILVVVPPFENLSSRKAEIDYAVEIARNPDVPRRTLKADRYAQVPREILEDIILGIGGVRAVERQRIDQYLLEKEGKMATSAVDLDKAMQMALKLDAHKILMGSILSIHERTAEFDGYGPKIGNRIWSARVRVRVINLVKKGDEADLQVPYSKILNGGLVLPINAYAKMQISEQEIADHILNDVLEGLRADENFHEALKGEDKPTAVGGLVEIEMNVLPNGADIFIDGDYVGATPKPVRLKSGKRVRLRFEKKGYESWEATIVPEQGMQIRRELASEEGPRQIPGTSGVTNPVGR